MSDTVINDITSPTGQIWMDRNLGSFKIAESLDDIESFGDYYMLHDIPYISGGYRVPTAEEWQREIDADTLWSVLKLPAAGLRYYYTQSLMYNGVFGYYISSSKYNYNLKCLTFGNKFASIFKNNKPLEFTVRLIKDVTSYENS